MANPEDTTEEKLDETSPQETAELPSGPEQGEQTDSSLSEPSQESEPVENQETPPEPVASMENTVEKKEAIPESAPAVASAAPASAPSPAAPAPALPAAGKDSITLSSLNVELAFLLGHQAISLEELKTLVEGKVIALGGSEFQASIVLQDKIIAQAQLVMVEGMPSLQITKTMS